MKILRTKYIQYIFIFVGISIFIFPNLSQAATEVFYICNGGDGTLPKTATCATAYDEADFSLSSNWSATVSNDNKIGPDDTVIFMDEGGVFDAKLTIQSSGLINTPITLQEMAGDDVIIDLSNSATESILINTKSYITIDGLTLNGGTTANLRTLNASSNIVIINLECDDGVKCVQFSSTSSDITVDGLIASGMTGNAINDLGVENSSYTNLNLQNSLRGLRLDSGSGTLSITDSTLSGATNANLHILNSSYSSGMIDNLTSIGGSPSIIFQNSSGFTIQNSKIDTATTGGLRINGGSSNIIIQTSEIYNAGIDGINFLTDASLDPTNITIRRNKIYSNGDKTDVGVAEGDGISCHGYSSNISIYLNLIYSNIQSGIALVNDCDVNFYNNTIYNNGGDFSGEGGQTTDRGNLYINQADTTGISNVKNNIITEGYPWNFRLQNTTDISDSDLVINNNTYWSASDPLGINFASLNGGSSTISWATYNVNYEANSNVSDPLFASTTPSLPVGFQIQALSPAIDAGTDVSLTTDYSGNSIYGVPDIGAYEYQPPYTIGSNNIPTTGSTRIYSNGKYRMRTASSTSATTSFTVTPLGGSYQATTTQYMDLTIDTWQTTGNQNKQWTATSTAGTFLTKATTTVYTVGDLLPSTYYQFKLDNTASSTAVTGSTCNSNGACLSDSSGQIVFNYIGGYSTHIFALEKDTTGPSSFSLVTGDDTKVSVTNPTLVWDATLDSSSSLSKYQLYVDGSLDTDNISPSATSVTPTNALNCGGHTWYVKAIDNQGNGTNSSTYTITMTCGGGIFTGSVSSLPGYVKPRLQTIQPDGAIIYHNETETSIDIPTTDKVVALPITKVSPKIQFLSYLQIGDRNNEVVLLQQKLRELGFFTYPENTGYFGSITEEAVKIFQEENGIETVGVVGPKTRTVLNVTPTQPTTISSVYTFTKYLIIGKTGEEVRQLQQTLRELGYFVYPKNTGYFGAITEEAVRNFQRNHGIEAVGVVGPQTRGVLNAR